jgi:hypothetical protein
MDEAAWEGLEVDAIDDRGVGRVDGLFVDAESDEPVWVVVKPGRFGREIAIPFGDCAPVIDRVWVPHSWRSLRGAPVIDRARPLTREQELAICAHYGIGPGEGRVGELEQRTEAEVTACPSGPAD